MESTVQYKLKAITNHLHEYLNTENKITMAKLQYYLKTTKKTHEDHLTEEVYYQSPLEQAENLERRVKNNVKHKLSDFQAYLHFTKKEDLQQDFPQLVKMLKISDKPKKHTHDHSHEPKGQELKILELSMHELCRVTSSFLEEKGKCRELIKQKQLSKLIRLISEEYNITSYHNFTHSVSVMMLFRQIEKKMRLNEHFSELRLFVAEMAALAHDLGHKGLNASWEVKTKSHLANIYHSESLLEKMHIAKFFRLMKEHKEVDFFLAIKDIRQRECAKKEFIRLILGTDMTKHFKTLEAFQQKQRESSENFIATHKEDILELIFHAADIGNPCMQFEDYMNWSILLTFEFHAQAVKEEKAGVAVTPGFKYSGLEDFYSGQIGFINTFCLPLWKTIATIYPLASYYLQKIDQNCLQLQSRLQELKEGENCG